MRSHAAFVLGCLSILPGAACGPAATAPVVAPKPPPVATKPAIKPAESPARWVLLPSAAGTAEARLEIEGVGTLYVGRSGDRWLDKKGSGLAAAEALIPQAVRGVIRDDGGRYAFVGAKGDVFFTKEPLGPVVETRAAKSELRSVSVGKRALLGLAQSGLVRSTDFGATWAPVSMPKIAGTLVQIAMLGEEGLLLVAPQRVLATADDGQSWQPLATPGVGARRVVADANGELVLEGLTASAMLRRSPLRLEKVMRAPTAGWDLPATEAHGALLGSDAIYSGAAAIIGERFVEAVQDQDQPERWRLAIAELGKPPVLKPVAALDHCDRVYVAGSGSTLLLACTSTQPPPAPKSKWGPAPSYHATNVKLLKSTDSGASFREEGAVAGSDRDKLMWIAPDGLLLVDGACKRTRNEWECSESPPVVRPPGAKAFAKAVSAPGIRFDRVAFGPNNTAFALGTDATSRPTLFISKDGGRDFIRRALPTVLDDKGDAHLASGTGATLGVDETGVYVVVRSDHGRMLRYSAGPDGGGLKGQVLAAEFDSVDLAGRRGFGYIERGEGFETADGGATWSKVSAPALNTSVPLERLVACGAYGCVIGDRATRVGWELALGTAGQAVAAPAPKKSLYRTPIRCSADGEWKPMPGATSASASNADLGGPSRWALSKRDPQKGALAAVLGSFGPKGLEVKEVPLFAPGPTDTAGAITMQVEGVAALRYSFKRDKTATSIPMPPPKPPITGPLTKKFPMPMPSYAPKVPAITAKQLVDVEVAWWVAATGKVHRATLKGVGPLDPSRDVVDARELPSTARTSLLSIGAGGIHVRPFASMGPDAPLYWITDAGKIEKLTWPEVPAKDVRGRNLPLRLDAARVGGRSVVFGDIGGGLQLFLAWANPNGTSWETRAWGLWPETEPPTDLWLRFVESSDKPIVGVLAKNKTGTAGWAFPMGGVQSDPEGVVPMATLESTSDPPKACGKNAGPWRVLTPWSAGTRHPLIVSSDGRDLPLATATAILRTGPGGDACVSTLDALPVAGAFKPVGSEWYTALLSPDDLGHASLFKSTWKSGTPGTEISVRPMTCTLSPGPLPEGYASTPGFVE